MGKYIKWFFLLIKSSLKSKTGYLQGLGLLLIILVLSNTNFKAEGFEVGIYNGNSILGEEVIEDLLKGDSIYSFKVYKNKDDIISDVYNGSIQCGFIINEDFDTIISSGLTNNSITYVGTSFSKTGIIIKESVFKSVFKISSEKILEKSLEAYSLPKGYKEFAKNQNSIYLKTESLLKVNKEFIQTLNNTESTTKDIYTLKGIIGIFIFICLFFSYGKSLSPSYKSLLELLTKGDRFIFKLILSISNSIIPILTALVLLPIIPNFRGALEIIRLIVFILGCSLWIGLLGLFIKNKYSLVSWIIPIIAITLVLCPVFFDISSFIEPIKYIRYLLPLSLYI